MLSGKSRICFYADYEAKGSLKSNRSIMIILQLAIYEKHVENANNLRQQKYCTLNMSYLYMIHQT